MKTRKLGFRSPVVEAGAGLRKRLVEQKLSFIYSSFTVNGDRTWIISHSNLYCMACVWVFFVEMRIKNKLLLMVNSSLFDKKKLFFTHFHIGYDCYLTVTDVYRFYCINKYLFYL